MENGGIKEVVMGFNSLIDNVNDKCGDEAANKLFIASRAVLKDLLPEKYFILREKEWSTDILIFDSKEARDEWLLAKSSLPFHPTKKVVFSKIEFPKVDELLDGEWDELNYYRATSDGVLTLKVW